MVSGIYAEPGLVNQLGKLLAELIGAAVFLFIIQLSIATGSPNTPLSIGLGLTAIVYTCGPLSGGHINPAVTLAIFIRGKIEGSDAIFYWISQLIGGLIGALVGGVVSGNFAAPAVGENHNLLQAWLAEFIFTAILSFVVLSVATLSKSDGNSFYGLSIGAVIFTGIVSAGTISGGAFNPAVIVGLTGAKNFWKLWKFGYVLWIVMAELAGGACGAFAFYITASEEFSMYRPDSAGLGLTSELALAPDKAFSALP